MKKILYIVSTLQKAGPINQLSYIIKYLDKSKFEPVILTLSSEPENSMMEYFKKELSVNVESLDLSRLEGIFKGVSKIKEYIEKNSMDLIHTQGIRADGLIKNIKIPKVTTLRNYPYYDYPSKFGKLKGNLMVYSHMNTIKSNQDNCIACAKSISDEFKKNGLNLQYIQNGVDIEKFKPLNKEEIHNLQNKYKITKNKKIFITVGSLIPRKDVETLIKGFKLFNKDDSSILLIAGDGFEKNNLKTISDESIIFLGNISNVVEYLQLSDCFISASLAEGLPNTVLEAMACGLPTVLSSIPSHEELYENEKGNFFTVKNYKELAMMLETASKDFSKEKEESLKIIENRFSAKTMSGKYQDLYMEKLNESI